MQRGVPCRQPPTRWHRNIFSGRDVPDEHVLLLAAYCRREIAALHKVPIVDVYAGLIPWGPVIGETSEGAHASCRDALACLRAWAGGVACWMRAGDSCAWCG